MGRAPRHLTLQDKLQARQAAKRRYAASDRGKSMKSAQNARAYMRRAAKKPANDRKSSVTFLDKDPLPDIPAHLVAIAQRPLSSSRLFNQALQSADSLDESDLAIWDSRPPYRTLPAHQEDDAECRFTERLVEVMDGKRLRELRGDGEERLRRVTVSGPREIAGELEERVRELLAVCRDSDDTIASAKLPGSSSRDLRMARHHYDWAARELYCAHSDLLILRKLGADADEYRHMYHRKELAWQVIRVE